MKIERYGVYMADLNPTVGSELKKVMPVVVVSQDEMNKHLETVVVCPLTSRLHPRWRCRLQLKCAKKQSEIAVDQIRAVSKSRLKKRIDILCETEAARLRKLISDMYCE